MIAGRVLRATRALRADPETENFPDQRAHTGRRSFRPRRRSPKLHSGPSTQRVVPYQNDAHNQQPQKPQHTKVKGTKGIMEKLTITTPSDVLSFIGHTLGFWPQESLVCITLNENSIGATLRIDLPRQAGQELPYARTVAHYLTSDTTATSVLFAVYTSETSQHGQPRP